MLSPGSLRAINYQNSRFTSTSSCFDGLGKKDRGRKPQPEESSEDKDESRESDESSFVMVGVKENE